IAFSQNAITRGSRIARQRHVFLIDLVSRAADTDIRPVAVEALNAGIDAPAVLMIVVVVAVAAATVAAARSSSGVLIVSHASLLGGWDVWGLYAAARCLFNRN